MKRTSLIKALPLILLMALFAAPGQAVPLGTDFLYQGFLLVNGRPATNTYEMTFRLFRQGDPVGASITNNTVSVMLGVFTVRLDFGAGVFDGTAYELGIAVREPGTGGPFVALLPRQPLTATPNAIYARTVGSVPDAALSSNVPLLNRNAVFTSGISVTTLQVRNSEGGGVLQFGPNSNCTVGVDPQLAPGLLLRDPRGIRILAPDPAFPPVLRFGPTDDCSLGIDPAFPGLVERDPIGFRLLGRNNQGCRLIFGPTMNCTVEVNPDGPQGLLLRDPRGIRILSPETNSPSVLRFGPTDDCSLGIDPAFPGLVERDPIGFRLLGRNDQGCRLIFGPTINCTVEVNPAGPKGLLLRDVNGIRLLSPDAERPPLLRFGPTDNCSIGLDTTLSGLIVRDPRGLRIAPPLAATALPTLRFGPTDDCSLGIDPAFPGLVERDPIGFRLLGRNDQGCRLILGPTMNCTVEVDPAGPRGLLLRDPNGIRILNPDPAGPNTLVFGPTDNCRISTDLPNSEIGMRFSDPRGFAFESLVRVNGPVFARDFVSTSSRRFKSDVKPIEQPLEKISQLQGVGFTWKEEQGGHKDIGFIAEDVAKVIPEVVSWEEDGRNARGVNYDHLVAVAIEGIKAQQTQIQTLEREKTQLKESLDAMQAKLNLLNQKLETFMAR